MKDENDNKAVDWVGTSVSQIAIFERAISVLKTIQTTPVASTSEIRDQALIGMSLRATQRYLKGLEGAGYICRNQSPHYDARFFLTDKAKQLFGATV